MLFVDVAQRVQLVAFRDFAVELLHAFCSPLLRRDRNPFGLAHVAVDEAADALGHGRAEERGLPLLGHRAEDVVDVAREPDVEHLVGLVEDDEAHTLQAQRPTLQVVDHAARRADDHVGAALEAGEVGTDACCPRRAQAW